MVLLKNIYISVNLPLIKDYIFFNKLNNTSCHIKTHNSNFFNHHPHKNHTLSLISLSI